MTKYTKIAASCARRLSILRSHGAMRVILALAFTLVPDHVSSFAAVFLRADNQQVVSSQAPTVSTVDLYFTRGGGQGESIVAYQVQLSVSPADGALTFTGVSALPLSAPHPPIFPGSTPIMRMAGTTLQVGDDEEAPFPITDGLGLVRLQYTVQPNVVGVFDVKFELDPEKTMLVDLNAELVPFTPINFQITVVPEPKSVAVASSLLLLGFGIYRKWAHRARSQ